MDEKSFETLELDSLIDLLVRHVQTPLGRMRAAGLRPTTDRTAIERDLNLTSEGVAYLETGGRFGLHGIEDPGDALAGLAIEGTSLEAGQVLLLEHLLSAGMDLRAHFRDPEMQSLYPGLSAIAMRVPDLRKLASQIRGKVLPGGDIDDNASPELRSIRREIVVSRARIHRSLESLMRRQEHAVQEEIITFRNGRFVIPVRTDSRSQVPGVMHGLSSSGQTTYMEPFEVIEQNNELVRLREEEQIETARILFAIAEMFRSNLPGLKASSEAVAELDFVQAKAMLSLEFQSVRPRISESARLVLSDARHILLDRTLREAGGGAVPVSFELTDDTRTMVVSGPNAGGKTVVLKTVGMISLMTQMGLHVPASEAVMPVFDQILADIGDQQSIAANLSTFTAHLRNIAGMARRLHPPALLLLDEVGTGTDPDEGAALGVAIVDYFRKSGATTIATTHYNQLKMWAAGTPGVLNSSVEFDERSLRPTYRLITGVAGSSSGLEIARRMDLPQAILDRAGALVNPDHVRAGEYLKRIKETLDEQQSLKASLEEEHRAALAEHARLQARFEQQEDERRREFEQGLAGVIEDFRASSDRLLRGLKDRIEAERLRKAAASRAAQLRRAGRELEQKAGEQLGLPAETAEAADRIPGEPGEGDRVMVKPLGREGAVESVHEGTYIVNVGSLKFRAAREDLQLLKPAPAAKAGAAAAQARKPAFEVDADKAFTPELKVIGMTADEATDRVDKFLDEAFLAGVESVRVIHGHGKGILRRAIADLLTDHPQVAGFHPAPPNQGGGGATIVLLRQ